MGDAPDNLKGATSAFATLTPFRSKLFARWERLILINSKTFLAAEPTIRKLSFLHHAYWVKVPAHSQSCRARGRQTGHGSLLFMSYFTGDLLDYLEGFTTKLSTAMDLLWGPCEEWPGAASYGQCVQFVKKYRRPTAVYFNGRADLNVGDTRVALWTRKQLEELAALEAKLTCDAGGDASFAEAYDAVVFTAFGHNGARTEDGLNGASA